MPAGTLHEWKTAHEGANARTGRLGRSSKTNLAGVLTEALEVLATNSGTDSRTISDTLLPAEVLETSEFGKSAKHLGYAAEALPAS